MRNIRNLEPDSVNVVDSNLNVFEARTEGFVFTVRQPRKIDSSSHRRAWKKLSNQTLHRYMRKQYVGSEIYDSKWRCKQPLYRGEVPGFVSFIMVVGGKIVGFGDFMFRYGTELSQYKIDDKEVGANMNLCVLDKYHGLGIGSYYGNISIFIARHFGADYALGFTPIKKGMFNIRMKDRWEFVRRRGNYAVIRKKL